MKIRLGLALSCMLAASGLKAGEGKLGFIKEFFREYGKSIFYNTMGYTAGDHLSYVVKKGEHISSKPDRDRILQFKGVSAIVGDGAMLYMAYRLGSWALSSKKDKKEHHLPKRNN